MSDPRSQDDTGLHDTRVHRVERECDLFEAAWKAGRRPRVEDHVVAAPESERPALLRELILLEIDYRRLAGEHPTAQEFLTRFPDLDRAWILAVFSEAERRPPASHPDEAARLGKFLLLDKLGAGGFGTVWRARDAELDRIVAVKIPNPDSLPTVEARARFRREARAAARLSHPNVVMLFDVEQVGETSFLVMEYVDGTDLGRLVKQAGPLPVRQACEFIRQAALGLQHAHERGLVHRDVKPANLLVTAPRNPVPEGEPGRDEGRVVKVADLGLARMTHGPTDPNGPVTQVGAVVGTIDYIAPEQACDSSKADPRADVYSLGCTLYYLLTGRAPYPDGTLAEKLMRHVTAEETAVELNPPEAPPAVTALVRRMMARRPDDRPQTAAEVAAALAVLLDSTGHGAPPAAAAAAPRPASRRRFAAVGLLLGAVTLALIAAVVILNRKPTPPGNGPAPTGGPEPVVVNSIGMELALVRPGRFLMGSPGSVPDKMADEMPQHPVEITRAFYIGVCEVTQGQFQDVMGYNPSYFSPTGKGKEDFQGKDTSRHPVDSVTWPQAKEFCDSLSDLPGEKRAGRRYRLPTEAEWEYACRGGAQAPYHFGPDASDLGLYAWDSDNASGQTHPVKLKKPNPWNLYDMYGNVWEWCEDCYDPEYYRKSPPQDPLCGAPTQMRAVRGGGGKYDSAWFCRSAKRSKAEPTEVQNYIGLRVAFTAPTAP